jgi:DNA-binding protein Fis
MLLVLFLLSLFLFCFQLSFSPSNKSILDKKIENIFISRISKQTCKENIEFYTKNSHMSGTENQKNLTQHMKHQFENYFQQANENDYSIYTETYEVLLSHPTDESKLELFEGLTKVHHFDLIEDPTFNETIYKGSTIFNEN